jgi:small-conductance mechanosensitive channel
VYETPEDRIERAVAIVRKAVEAREKTRFDRAHFKGYGDSSLDFEVVYFVLDPDFNLYMDIQHAINLDMLRTFRAEGIEFAYPTRTLYIANGGEASPGGHAQPAAGV